MKKIIPLIMLLLIISNLSFSQKLHSAEPQTREDYLLKSQKQKRISLAVGIPGAVILSVGSILYLSEFDNGLPGGTNYNANKSNTGEALMYIGGGIILAAIPFQIASRINRKKAMAITFKNQRTPNVSQNHIVSKFNPSVNLAINF